MEAYTPENISTQIFDPELWIKQHLENLSRLILSLVAIG